MMASRILTIYLAGPINGCTDDECNNWRDWFASAIDPLHTTLNPMRRDYRGIESGFARAIVDLDKLDVRSADVVVAYCPVPSVGTSMEILYAWERGTPVVCVVPDGSPVSPWLEYHSTVVVKTLQQAVDFIGLV